jgi:hypothetical protein
MAEQSRIIEIRVDTQFNEKRLGQLESSLASVQKARAELLKQSKTSTGLNKQEEAELGRLSNLQQRLSGAVSQTKKELKDLNKEKKTAVTSYDAITQRNAKLSKELRALADPLGKNKVRFQELAAEIKKNTDTLATMDEAQGRFQRNVGNYPEMLGKLAPAQTAVITGMWGMVKASLAFIATPLGAALAVIVALATPVVAFFTKSQRGADMLSTASAGLSATFNVLVDRLVLLGEWMVKAFTSPKEALKDFGNLLQNFIMKRVQLVIDGFGLMGSAAMKLFKGDFSGALADVGTAAKKLIIEMNPLAEVIESVGAEMKKESKEAMALAKRTKALTVAKRELIVAEAELEHQIQEAETRAKDEEISKEERLKGINEAIRINNELASRKLAIAQEEYEIVRDQNALGESMNADLDKEAELLAQLNRVKIEQLKTEKTLLSAKKKLTAATKEQKDETKKLKEEIIDLNKVYLDQQDDLEKVRLELIEDAQEKEIIMLMKHFDDMRELAHGDAELEKQLTEKQQRDILAIKEKYRQADLKSKKAVKEEENILEEISRDIAIQGIEMVSEQLNRNFERQRLTLTRQADSEKAILQEKLNNKEITEKAYRKRVDAIEKALFEKMKKQAIKENTINSAVAVMKSFAQYGWSPAFGKAAAAIGAGLIAQNILVETQQYEPVQFERGGLLQGKSHANGGIPMSVGGVGGFEAEGGEAIINKRSTSLFKPLLSAINEAGGGVKFAQGGLLPTTTLSDNMMGELTDLIRGQRDIRVINVATDTAETSNRVRNIQSNATFG